MMDTTDTSERASEMAVVYTVDQVCFGEILQHPTRNNESLHRHVCYAFNNSSLSLSQSSFRFLIFHFFSPTLKFRKPILMEGMKHLVEKRNCFSLMENHKESERAIERVGHYVVH